MILEIVAGGLAFALGHHRIAISLLSGALHLAPVDKAAILR
jgi:hypothetical protein